MYDCYNCLMKKILHGKRYLRSRASVQVGRQRRFNRKFTKSIPTLGQLVDIITNAFYPAFQEVANQIQEVVDNLHSLIASCLDV